MKVERSSETSVNCTVSDPRCEMLSSNILQILDTKVQVWDSEANFFFGY
jgi:hypothetical protein